MAREYRDTARHQNRSKGLKMAFTAVLCFGLSTALLETGAKMPPAGRRRPHKRRGAAGGYRGTRAKENPPQEGPGRALMVFKIFSPFPR